MRTPRLGCSYEGVLTTDSPRGTQFRFNPGFECDRLLGGDQEVDEF